MRRRTVARFFQPRNVNFSPSEAAENSLGSAFTLQRRLYLAGRTSSLMYLRVPPWSTRRRGKNSISAHLSQHQITNLSLKKMFSPFRFGCHPDRTLAARTVKLTPSILLTPFTCWCRHAFSSRHPRAASGVVLCVELFDWNRLCLSAPLEPDARPPPFSPGKASFL
jgi:hypothetical protein